MLVLVPLHQIASLRGYGSLQAYTFFFGEENSNNSTKYLWRPHTAVGARDATKRGRQGFHTQEGQTLVGKGRSFTKNLTKDWL